LEIPKEKNPNQPIVSEARYEAMLAVADQVDWRFRLALVLAHETGHRIGAIRQLRWSDIDLDQKTVVWRAPTDKVGFEHTTYITEAAVEALERARTDHPGIGSAWVMPAPRDGSKPCSRDLVRAWWYRAERKAGLERIRGLGWHGLRRKFATDLKDVPLVDLGALGGWKRPETILRLYQQPDLETQQAALAKRRKVAASQH
jgi:integrase